MVSIAGQKNWCRSARCFWIASSYSGVGHECKSNIEPNVNYVSIGLSGRSVDA